MATPPVDPAVLEDIFDAGLDDWVSLDEVGFAISRIQQLDDIAVCEEMCRVVRALVDDGLFEPGTYHDDRGFVPLDEPLDDVLARVRATYDGIADASWWELLWLKLTEVGRTEAERVVSPRPDEP